MAWRQASNASARCGALHETTTLASPTASAPVRCKSATLRTGHRSNISAAIYCYNHSDWYVSDVLGLAALYGQGGGGGAFSVDPLQRQLDSVREQVTNPIGCNVKWKGKPEKWMPPEACDLV